MTILTIHWELIADCLRDELADYGGLLHLFEEQQHGLFARNADTVLRLAGEIDGHLRTVVECREKRERMVSLFALENERAANSTLRSLIPLVPTEAQPLISALIAEVNALIHRVRRVSRHNHTLLSRSVEMSQETLQQLRPANFNPTYAPDGRRASVNGGVALRAAG